jgi:hypothetical protein
MKHKIWLIGDGNKKNERMKKPIWAKRQKKIRDGEGKWRKKGLPE